MGREKGRPSLLTSYIGNQLLKKFQAQIGNSYVKAYEDMLHDAYEDAFYLYQTAIKRYYEYETVVYVRHGEPGPGTCSGANLLLANRTTITSRKAINRTLNIKSSALKTCHVRVLWDAGHMLTYPYVSRDTVLENVLNGVRGLNSDEMNKAISKRGSVNPKRSQSWLIGDPNIILPNSKIRLSGTLNSMLDEYLARASRANTIIFNRHLNTRREQLMASILGGKSWHKGIL